MTASPVRYRQQESADAVILEPATRPVAAVIWLHGLGADGHDFVPVVAELSLPANLPVRFVFPHAPVRPVTVNNGFAMRAWYDIRVLSSSALAGPGTEDVSGIRQSEQSVRSLIDAQGAAGIAPDRIVLAGFSQGGAIALQTGLRHPARLAGVIALSTYLPLRDVAAAEASAAGREIPILMCHGTADPIVPFALGERSRDALRSLDCPVEWHAYPMPHSVCDAEIADISRWLQGRLSAVMT